MADKLSERLETLVRNACPGWHAAETIREAAELARRVEGAPCEKVTHWEQACFAKAGVPIPDEGSYVRLVPEPPEVG